MIFIFLINYLYYESRFLCKINLNFATQEEASRVQTEHITIVFFFSSRRNERRLTHVLITVKARTSCLLLE